ncbi:MAG: alpha/beta fold hydrolase [Anaerolineales bacterium]|jgi:pimeloyl-ACP methyl ester carboxylesterase
MGGCGPTFVLLHGLAIGSLTWTSVASFLSQAGHRVLANDQRGHGLSERTVRGFGFDGMCADLEGLLRERDVRDPILVGQSWGGSVVMGYALATRARRGDSVSCMGASWIFMTSQGPLGNRLGGNCVRLT